MAVHALCIPSTAWLQAAVHAVVWGISCRTSCCRPLLAAAAALRTTASTSRAAAALPTASPMLCCKLEGCSCWLLVGSPWPPWLAAGWMGVAPGGATAAPATACSAYLHHFWSAFGGDGGRRGPTVQSRRGKAPRRLHPLPPSALVLWHPEVTLQSGRAVQGRSECDRCLVQKCHC